MGLSKDIVVLEKDIALAHLVCRGLECEGFTVHVVSEWGKATEILKGSKTFLFIVDLQLLDMAAGDASHDLQGCPYIVMLNSGEESLAVEMLELGAKGYLIKDSGFLEFLPFVVKNVLKQLDIEEELAKAREDIVKNEAELHFLRENMLELVGKVDEEGNFQYVSPSYKEVLGYEPADLVGKSAFDYIWPEDLQQAIKVFQSGLTITAGESKEFRFKHKKGFYVWLEVKVSLAYDSERKINGTIWSSRDVTRCKEVEDELLACQEKYSRVLNELHAGALFENSTDAIAFIDPEHKCRDTNRQFTNLFGYTIDEVKGKDLDQVLAAGNKYAEANHLTALILRGASVDLESIRFKKGGKAIDVNVKGVPALINGEIAGSYVIYSNITERKRAAEALQRSEEWHREILSAMEEGYYEMDLAGSITFCNDAACRLMDLAREDLVGTNFPLLFKDANQVHRVFQRVHASTRSEQGIIVEIALANGNSRFNEFSVSLIRDKNDKIQGFRGVGRDITDRIKHEEKMRELSLHDQMTGTYNRTYFEEELRRLQGSRDYPITIITADLDGLKLINDTMGHHQGDELLKTCAQVLKKPLRSSDVLARVGGDEFTAILPRTDEKTGETIIQRIITALEKNNETKPDLPLSVSLGAATAADSDEPLEKVFKKADDLMYKDKLMRSANSRMKIVSALLQVLEERDHISDGHADRLKELSLKIAERLGLSIHQKNGLSLLSRVHDLGKVGIPEYILFKEGPLTADDWEVIRLHPEKGYRIATSSPSLAVVADLILRHHEWWDGSGYPLGLKGEEIPIECRILAIIDAYDNMIHGFYSKAMSSDEAIRELRKNAGTQFDPQLVDQIVPIIIEGIN